MNEFEFELNGQLFYTGTKLPDVKPLGRFAEFPESELLSLDAAIAILRNPNRRRSRDIFGPDWILNQGRRSSCNAYMIRGILERIRARNGFTHCRFAAESVYMRINGGRDQGSMLDEGMEAMIQDGMALEGTVPYESYSLSELGMEQKRYMLQEAKRFRFSRTDTYELPSHNVETLWRAMVSAVLRNYPIGIAVHVDNNFMATRSTNLAVAGFDRGPGNHAVGCDDAIPIKSLEQVNSFFDFRLDMFNSWGNWGDQGRALIRPEHVVEPSKYHVFYACREATRDPEEAFG